MGANSDFHGHARNERFALQNLGNNMQTPGGTLPFSYAHICVYLRVVSVDVPMLHGTLMERMSWNMSAAHSVHTRNASVMDRTINNKHIGTHTLEQTQRNARSGTHTLTRR